MQYTGKILANQNYEKNYLHFLRLIYIIIFILEKKRAYIFMCLRFLS